MAYNIAGGPGKNLYERRAMRQDIVVDQDLRNGLGSVLEFVAHALELAEAKGAKAGKDYLLRVAKDIITGRGHPAPNPGPVTPEAHNGGDE